MNGANLAPQIAEGPHPAFTRRPIAGCWGGSEHRVQQAGKALVDLGTPQRHGALAAGRLVADEPGFAQRLQVVREGRLRRAGVDAVTLRDRLRSLGCELAD